VGRRDRSPDPLVEGAGCAHSDERSNGSISATRADPGGHFAKVCNHPYMEWTRLSRRSNRYENPKGMDLDD